MLLRLLAVGLILDISMCCSFYSTCEQCAGSIVGNKTCRWCITTSSCITSKYRCRPTESTISTVNCPYSPSTPLPVYNDTFVRQQVIYYVLASNRINNSEVPNAVQSCFDKAGSSIRIVREFRAPTFNQKQVVSAVLAVDDQNSRVILALQSTVGLYQFMTEGFLFIIATYQDFPFGGKVVKYYAEAYQGLLDAGLKNALDNTLLTLPHYEVLVTGHSMGGSLATIFSLHIALQYPNKVVEYALSGPRVGDEQFVKLHHQHVDISFRIIRRGDWVPDLPFRISELLTIPYHTKYEVFYDSHMSRDSYRICPQPEYEGCNRGSWFRKPTSHMFMFDQMMHTFNLGIC